MTWSKHRAASMWLKQYARDEAAVEPNLSVLALLGDGAAEVAQVVVGGG